MALSRVQVEDETAPSSLADHEINQFLGRLIPVCLGAALLLILSGSISGEPGIVRDGIVALIAAPILVMLASTWMFLRQHDHRFVAVGFFVLLVIVLSAVSGLR